MLQKVKLLNIELTQASRDDILEYINTRLQMKGEKIWIVTPNPELMVMANKSNEYSNILNSAQISLPDGIGVVLAAKILGVKINQRITGVDFMKSLCEKVSKQPINTGYFGARQGVAEQASECLQKEYPGLRVSYASHEWDYEKFKSSKTDILFVALGSPKQEQWIFNNLDALPVKVVMGVGGAFDMISGNVRRAPVVFQNMGVEWLWRLLNQPWRAKRQLKLLYFIWLVLRERFSK